MRLHWFFRSLIIFIAFFFVLRFIFLNDPPKPSLPVRLIDRKAVKLSSMYQPDCLDINTKVCPAYGKDIQLFIAVISAPDRAQQREAVRATWGHFSMRRDVAIAFFIGESSDIHIINKLDKEEEIYEDIVRCPFPDEPEVATLKVMQILEWTKKYCFEAKFLLKTNDDVFINVSKVLQLLLAVNMKDKSIYGRLARRWIPSRSVYDSNSVSSDEYQGPFFPDFTIGPTYLFPVHLCEELVTESLRQNYIKSDDIFLTGLVAQSLGIKRVHMEPFFNAELTINTCNARRAISLKCSKPIDLFDFWVVIHDLDVKCEKQPNSSQVEQKKSCGQEVLSSTGKDLEKMYIMTF